MLLENSQSHQAIQGQIFIQKQLNSLSISGKKGMYMPTLHEPLAHLPYNFGAPYIKVWQTWEDSGDLITNLPVKVRECQKARHSQM
jgi:hypothetical protein